MKDHKYRKMTDAELTEFINSSAPFHEERVAAMIEQKRREKKSTTLLLIMTFLILLLTAYLCLKDFIFQPPSLNQQIENNTFTNKYNQENQTINPIHQQPPSNGTVNK
jgi:hypothetical protein